MLHERQTEHMIAEALEVSKKIYGTTDHTNRSTFKADAKARQLMLEVHPDKSMAFCERNKVTSLHKVVEQFFTQAAAALPMVHKMEPSNIGLSEKSILLVEHWVLPNIFTSETSLKRKQITPPMK